MGALNIGVVQSFDQALDIAFSGKRPRIFVFESIEFFSNPVRVLHGLAESFCVLTLT